MALQQLLVSSMLLLFLWPLNPWPLVRAQSMAMRNCSDRCGDVIIPYPFGTTSGCYLNDAFRIDCPDKSTTPLLSLGNSTKLEVTRISVQDGTIEVMLPVVHDSSGSDNSSVPINFRGSPFAFSSTRNMFTANGCGFLALLTETPSDPLSIPTTSQVAGCTSLCYTNQYVTESSPATAPNGICSGINCCQTTIPACLQVFEATLSGINDGSSMLCRHAYLVNQTWFRIHVPSNLSSVEGMSHVPVVLDWEVDNISYAPILSSRSLEFNHSNSTKCELYNSTLNMGSVIVNCTCSMGYEGNAYIPSGCTDIDECAVRNDVCNYEPNSMCVNKMGSYFCDARKDSNSNSTAVLLLGVGLGIGVPLLAIIIWQLCRVFKNYRNKKLRKKFFKRNGGLLLQEQLLSGEVTIDTVKMFTSKELDKATDHYNVNRILGQGGQGTVYKGMLIDGRIVAMKKSKALDEGKTKQFINEIVILSQINHRNVVKVLGCCLETELPLIVYEFIPNGNLFEFLHDKKEELPLTWDMRLRIAVEVTEALSYLHSAVSIPIYHRDIKSTNILLDEKYRAKVADFGISKSVTIEQTHVTTGVQGTFGYFDPEYFRLSRYTDKSDVYSFGVVLVELLTGEKPICFTLSEEARSLAEYFICAIDENRLLDIVDAQVAVQGKSEEIMVVANLARRCLSWTGKERPTMKDISIALEGIRKPK